MDETSPYTYRVQRWSDLPHYVCLLCGYSTVGEAQGLPQLVTHLHEIHAVEPVEAPPFPDAPSILDEPPSA
jgi:hypothetical protein